jgi:hypothetical protein
MCQGCLCRFIRFVGVVVARFYIVGGGSSPLRGYLNDGVLFAVEEGGFSRTLS